MLRVGAISDADGKGRHTTTSRQLVELPGGALLIDTPGHARAAAVGRRVRGGRRLRRHRRAGGGLPLRGLRARRRAGLRGARRRSTPGASTPTGWSTTAGSGARRRSRRGSTTRRPRRNTSGAGSRSIRRRRRCTGIAIADRSRGCRMRGMRGPVHSGSRALRRASTGAEPDGPIVGGAARRRACAAPRTRAPATFASGSTRPKGRSSSRCIATGRRTAPIASTSW